MITSNGNIHVEISIPVFNEEKQLKENTTKLLEYIVKKQLWMNRYSVIIVDNASTDRTETIAKELAQHHSHLSYLRLDKKGRGRALRESWKRSKADIVAYMDIDLSADLNTLETLILEVENGTDVVIGSRLVSESEVQGRTWVREIMSRTYNSLIRWMFHTTFHDAQCGYKAIKTETFRRVEPYIQNQNWFFDTELLILTEKSGKSIKEIPIHWTDDPGSTVKVASTVFEDLEGLWRLWRTKPWQKI